MGTLLEYLSKYDNINNKLTTISGSQGGIQGCVLAPIGFGFSSLTTRANVKSLLDTKENSIYGAFLDDSVTSANHKDTVDAFGDGPKIL
jgi:hypothetical protein